MFFLVTTIIFWNFLPKVLKIYRRVFFQFWKSVIKYWAVHVTAFILPVREVSFRYHNKMADNNGTALPHETDFGISNDSYCWIYQVIWRTIAYGSNSFSSSLLHMFQLSHFEQEASILRGQLPSSRSFLKSSVLRWSWLKYRIFKTFSSRSHFLQTWCENLGS